MHRTSGQLDKFMRPVLLGCICLGLTASAVLFTNSRNADQTQVAELDQTAEQDQTLESDQTADLGGETPDNLAFVEDSIETSTRLWMNAGAPELVATCFTAVLEEAGKLTEPIDSNADLVAAYDSMTEEQQLELDNCRELSEVAPRQSRMILKQVSNLL